MLDMTIHSTSNMMMMSMPEPGSIGACTDPGQSF